MGSAILTTEIASRAVSIVKPAFLAAAELKVIHGNHFHIVVMDPTVHPWSGVGFGDAILYQASFGPREQLMGFRGVPSADMSFDDVEVPLDRLIVPAGGFPSLFRAFSIERLGNATMSLAIGQTALDRTARYVRERRQFGRPVMEFQLVQSGIADMVMRVEAARLLVYSAAVEAGQGAPSALSASLAKCTANEMAKAVTDQAIQLHGGYGYSAEFEIERLRRDADGWALAGGTPGMQRLRIASEYLGVRFPNRAPAPAARADRVS